MIGKQCFKLDYNKSKSVFQKNRKIGKTQKNRQVSHEKMEGILESKNTKKAVNHFINMINCFFSY